MFKKAVQMFIWIAILCISAADSGPYDSNVAFGITEMRRIIQKKISAMQVEYGGKTIGINECTSANATAKMPEISRSTFAASLYSVIMYDPDVPDRFSANQSIFLHYLEVNANSTAPGVVVASYVGPDPLVGVHHYVWMTYNQKQLLPTTSVVDRFNYPFRDFLDKQAAPLYGSVFRVPAPNAECKGKDGARFLKVPWLLISVLLLYTYVYGAELQ